MNKVIADYDITKHILDMIKTSEEYLVMVSPYIKPWGHLETQLQNCVERKVNVQLYYRADKEKEMKKFINKLKKIGIQLEPIDTLHAKIYLSEKMGVMTSMNLHDFSKSASREVGLVTDQRSTLKEFKSYIEDLINKPIIPKKGFMDMGKEFLINKLSGDDDNVPEEKIIKTQPNGDSESGYCIRCSESIALNVKSPYCRKCYKSWSKYKNKKYEEKHCHQCSKTWDTSFSKPICLTCFKSN